MAFDVKAFAEWHAHARLYLRERHRQAEFHRTKPNLTPAWAEAHSELAILIKKVSDAMLARLPQGELDRIDKGKKEEIDPKSFLLLSLVRRLEAFPRTLSCLIRKDGTVLIYSSDRALEGALYFGTRLLPRLRPIDYLVSRMSLRLIDRSLVFIARDFRKPHETEDDFKRENLRTVTRYYA